MENDNAGLKFRILNDGDIFVDNDKNTKVDHFSEITKVERMLYNFDQMERFCRLGKENNIDKDDNSFSKYYFVLKNFSDALIAGRAYYTYLIYQSSSLDIFNYRSIQSQNVICGSEEFLCIDILNSLIFFKLEEIYEKAICYISVIDKHGNERFTQTIEILISEKYNIEPSNSIFKFIKLETLLCNATELHHYDDLVLCVKLKLHKYGDPETEEKILSFFENGDPHSTEEEEKMKNLVERGLHFGEDSLFDSDTEKILCKWMNTEINKKTNNLFEKCLYFDEDFFFDSDIGKILCKNSFFFESRKNYSQFMTERRSVIILDNERKHLINICRILLADYIIVENSKEICELYKVANKYGLPRVIEFCRNMLKQHVCMDNIDAIHEIAETYSDTELIMILHNFQKINGKFICDLFYIDHQGRIEKMSDLEHLHNAFSGYIECDNPIELNREYRSFNFNYEEIDCKFHFSSIFNKNENGELTLSFESDFGKLLCKKSDSLKMQIDHSSSETIQIVKKYIEPFKNIYRLLMGGNYIQASTIFDIIRLYELSDFLEISLLMEICRNLFKRYICSRNYEPIRKLAEKCSDDIELKNIVETQCAECKRYVIMNAEKSLRRYFGSVNNEIQNEKYDFFK